MTIERYRHRRTVGSGPPSDLPFGEIAYSDADGLLHVGRPDGTTRSYQQQGPAGPQGEPGPAGSIIAPIVIPLTPLNGFMPLAGWANDLTAYPGLNVAILRFGLSSSNVPTGVVQVFSFSPDFSVGTSAQLVSFAPSNTAGDFFYVSENHVGVLNSGAYSNTGYCFGTVFFPYA